MSSSLHPADEYLRRRRRRLDIVRNDTYAAFALVTATVIALVWANMGSGYDEFWHTHTAIHIGGFNLEFTFHQWVDEGLMAIFFFMVGLDVRHELSIGDLRLPGRAVLPLAAAVGGLVVPAILFALLAADAGKASGWGIVISSDTAFILGMLALVGPRNAPRLRLFVLALAVIDDIAALAVIGLLYTENLNVMALGGVAAGLAAVWGLQRLGMWRAFPYIVVGLFTWYMMFLSGVHATLAGVLLALLMPVRHIRPNEVENAHALYRLFSQTPTPGMATVVRTSMSYIIPLNQRLSTLLPPYVNFIIVPLFALGNAGVVLSGDSMAAAFNSVVTWGVVAGLVVGKFVGITAASALVLWLVPASRLPGLDLPRIAGIGVMSGMGFTISLLVADLAYSDGVDSDFARIGVLIASALSLVLAAIIFKVGDKVAPLPVPEGDVLCRKVDPKTDHVIGKVDAPASLVVYAALNHEYRNRLAPAIQDMWELIDRDTINMVFRHQVHNEQEMQVALALEAAAAQGKFRPMLYALVEYDGELDDAALDAVAHELGLDVSEFWERVHNETDRARVLFDDSDSVGEEADGSPVVYYNDRRIHGVVNRWHLTELINK